MATADQLGFAVDPPPSYECCGAPRPRGSSALDYPHALGCPNPNLDIWFDRWGRTIRSLCCTREKPCPPGGCRRHRDKLLPVPYRGEN